MTTYEKFLNFKVYKAGGAPSKTGGARSKKGECPQQDLGNEYRNTGLSQNFPQLSAQFHNPLSLFPRTASSIWRSAYVEFFTTMGKIAVGMSSSKQASTRCRMAKCC